VTTLGSRLATRRIVLAPGVYDSFTAMLAEKAGFDALYLSGASVAYSRLGGPDIGLVTQTELEETLSRIADRVRVPVIVDADTGFGNALNVQRTVKRLERAGAAAIQLEDQTSPKRCGHLEGKSLVSESEMVGKVKAAVDARTRGDTLIVARTDAVAVEGLAPAIERAEAYLAAGADVLFIEAVRSRADMATVTQHFATRVPLLANMVEGGKTPVLPVDELEKIGYAIAIFPGGTARAAGFMFSEYFASLKKHGTTAPYRERMIDFDQLQELLGTAEILAAGKKYDQ
jgi:2-methylisocitrate lyase-like PEP mutase family enzyme